MGRCSSAKCTTQVPEAAILGEVASVFKQETRMDLLYLDWGLLGITLFAVPHAEVAWWHARS